MALILQIVIPVGVTLLVAVAVFFYLRKKRKSKSAQTGIEKDVSVSECDTAADECESTSRNIHTSERERHVTIITPIRGSSPPREKYSPQTARSEKTTVSKLERQLQDLYRERQESIEVAPGGYVFKNINLSPAIRLKKAVTYYTGAPIPSNAEKQDQPIQHRQLSASCGTAVGNSQPSQQLHNQLVGNNEHQRGGILTFFGL